MAYPTAWVSPAKLILPFQSGREPSPEDMKKTRDECGRLAIRLWVRSGTGEQTTHGFTGVQFAALGSESLPVD